MSEEQKAENQSNDGGIFTTLSFSNAQNQTNQTNPTIQKKDDSEFDDFDTVVLVGAEEQKMQTNTKPESVEKSNDESFGIKFLNEDKQNPSEKNIFSTDSSFKEKEMEALGVLPPPETPLQAKPLETKELEADFSKTFNTPIISTNEDESGNPLEIEEAKLRKLHKELKDKAGAKKAVVKERLEKLKKEKESLGKELEDIKELELTASKIEEKLKSLETIDSEIDSLEAKAKEELQ